MLDNYEQLPNGVIRQKTITCPMVYNIAYAQDYNKYGARGRELAHLRLGVLVGGMGRLPRSVLDVGFGNGEFLRVCREAGIETCLGTDVTGASPPEGCSLITDPVKAEIELTCMYDSLEHMPDIGWLWQLKSQWLMVTVPWCHYFSPEWFERWHHRKPDEHLWHFNNSSLVRFMAEMGWEPVFVNHYEDIIRLGRDEHPNILCALFRRASYTGKTVLVTGGTGFIGSHLVCGLAKQGARVVCWDRNQTTSLSRIKDGDIDYVQGSLTPGDLATLDTYKLDYIFHQAALVDTTVTDRGVFERDNVDGFNHVLDLARRHGAKLVYASSAAVYGKGPEPQVVGKGEDPLNLYAQSKLANEISARAANVAHTFPGCVGLRYFNVYGPGEAHKGAMASMLYQLWLQTTTSTPGCVTLFKAGEQSRDFIHVKDVVRLNLQAGLYFRPGVYNAGTGHPRTFNHIVRLLERARQAGHITVTYIDNPHESFYQDHTQADMEETALWLHFKPSWAVDEEIQGYFGELDRLKGSDASVKHEQD